MDYWLITNKRHRVAHVAGPGNKPLCDPRTGRTFAATLLGRGMRVCETCARAELRSR
jgi:hypothetical protein